MRPLGVIEAGAEAAIAAGWARPLAGPDRAFTAVEVWQRGEAGSERQLVPVTALDRFAQDLAPAAVDRLAERLGRLAAPPARPPGLPDQRPLLMGVVNVTPDSFSDGGQFLDPERAVAHGLQLRAEGADLVDVGGESTRPGAAPVAIDEELRRVLPVVEALARAGVMVSIDTRRAPVMQAAIAAGARLINDISALCHDPASLAVAGASGLPVVLMHCQGEPQTMQAAPSYEHAALDVLDQLEARIEAWTKAGHARDRLLIDPGIGFGKTLEHNLLILHLLDLLPALGVPVLLGVSRKSLIARLAGDLAPPARLPGSLAAALFGLGRGVAVLRVHDVAATRQAVRVWQALAAGSPLSRRPVGAIA